MSKRNQKPFWNADTIAAAKAVNPPHVMVAVFTGAERTGWVHPNLMTVLMRLSYDPRIRVSYVPIHAIYPVSAARNACVEDIFLKSDCETVVLIDNDVVPPPNVADAIVSMPAECNIAVLPYWVWLPSEMHTMPCFGRWEDGQMIIPDITTLTPGWQEMGAGGTGCMFIRRKVFESGKLSRPFFKIISHETRGQVVSEDIYFTGLAADAGFPTWVNTDFICSHFHTVDLAEVNQGTVRILDRFTAALQQKYGEAGTTVGSLIQELQPELQNAKKTRDQKRVDLTGEEPEKLPALPVSEWKK